MILVYSNEFPTAIGGVGSFVFAIVNCLSDKDRDLVVITRKFSAADKSFDAKQRFAIIRAPMLSNVFLSYLSGAIYFLSVVIRRRPNEIFLCDVLSQRIFSCLQFLIRKAKIYVIAHGSEVMANYKERGIKRLLFCSVYKRADKIIANSNYTRDLLINQAVASEKIVVLNPGLSSQWFNLKSSPERIRKRFGLEGKSVLLTVARLSARKGQDTVISALPLIVIGHPQVRYLMVGEGEYKQSLEEQVRLLNLSQYVIFAGKVAQEDLIEYYDACDLFVMASRREGNLTEGFGISLIEAGARGKPVVGMRVGGVEDAILNNQTGFLANPDDSEEFADYVSRLLGDTRLAKSMGENARKHVFEHFYWNSEVGSRLKPIFED